MDPSRNSVIAHTHKAHAIRTETKYLYKNRYKNIGGLGLFKIFFMYLSELYCMFRIKVNSKVNVKYRKKGVWKFILFIYIYIV